MRNRALRLLRYIRYEALTKRQETSREEYTVILNIGKTGDSHFWAQHEVKPRSRLPLAIESRRCRIDTHRNLYLYLGLDSVTL
jgi:hypothetical protein